MLMVPAKVKGDPEVQLVSTPDIVTPDSAMPPRTVTLNVPEVVAEPEIVRPLPFGPAVALRPMLAEPLTYEKLSVVCAVHEFGSGRPKRLPAVNDPWSDTEEVADPPVPL